MFVVVLIPAQYRADFQNPQFLGDTYFGYCPSICRHINLFSHCDLGALGFEIWCMIWILCEEKRWRYIKDSIFVINMHDTNAIKELLCYKFWLSKNHEIDDLWLPTANEKYKKNVCRLGQNPYTKHTLLQKFKKCSKLNIITRKMVKNALFSAMGREPLRLQNAAQNGAFLRIMNRCTNPRRFFFVQIRWWNCPESNV